MSEEALNDDEEIAVMERLVRISMAKKELAEEEEILKAYFKERPAQFEPGVHHKGKFYVKVGKTTRIDDKLAREHLSPGAYKQNSKEIIDTTRARRNLTPAMLEAITKVYPNSIEVGLI